MECISSNPTTANKFPLLLLLNVRLLIPFSNNPVILHIFFKFCESHTHINGIIPFYPEAILPVYLCYAILVISSVCSIKNLYYFVYIFITIQSDAVEYIISS